MSARIDDYVRSHLHEWVARMAPLSYQTDPDVRDQWDGIESKMLALVEDDPTMLDLGWPTVFTAARAGVRS